MASHALGYTLHDIKMGSAGMVFEIKEDKEKLGELRVSNGAVVLFPKGKQ